MPNGRHEDRPDVDIEEGVTELASQVARLARVGEEWLSRLPSGSLSPTPSIRYQESIPPPLVPRRLSWHERAREKRVSLPSAVGWSSAIFALAEALRVLFTHW